MKLPKMKRRNEELTQTVTISLDEYRSLADSDTTLTNLMMFLDSETSYYIRVNQIRALLDMKLLEEPVYDTPAIKPPEKGEANEDQP